MAINRGTIRRLEKALRGDLESFELLDGSRYYYDAMEVHKELFLFAFDLQFGQVGEVPQFFEKLTRAKDPAAVLQRIEPENPKAAFVNPSALFDVDILVHQRQLVPNVGEEPEELFE